MTEIKLSTTSKLTLKWIRDDLLILETWAPGHSRDGYGWLLQSQIQLTGADLTRFVDAIIQPQEVT